MIANGNTYCKIASFGPVLPPEYQEVEYIEGTGTQYINTGYIPNETSGMYFKASTNSTDDTTFIGLREDGIRWWVGSSGWKVYGGWDANDPSDKRPVIISDIPFTYKLNYLNNRKRIYNDIEITPLGSSTIGTRTIPAYIMSGNGDGTERGFQKKGRIYYVIFTEGQNIVHHYIPCYKKSDGIIGMYDLANRTFYINQGTGTFLKGNNVVHTIRYKIPTEEYAD